MTRQKFIQDTFEQIFSHKSEQVAHAPGRVNLIGDHTDYNDGFVLPVAINFGTDVAASKRNDRIIRVYAHDCGQETIEFSLDDITFDPNNMWGNYVKGTIKVLQESDTAFFKGLSGANIAISGNVPQGAGLSSSASLEIAILNIMVKLYDLSLDGVTAAKLGQSAENNFVGCNCGIMDQLISAMGKQGSAMLLDCQDFSFEDALIPDDISLFIVNSNVKRGLVDSEYNLRREQCEAVAKHFGSTTLREVSLAQLNKARAELDPVLFQRAHHVLTENERTVNALDALNRNDMPRLSQLMADSHTSLRDDFAVSTVKVDALVEIMQEVVGSQGGVRMTGGGFGGCVVAAVKSDLVKQLSDAVNSKYPKVSGLTPDIYICAPSQGAFRA